MVTKFVTKKMALKGGKTKQQYLSACADKGIKAVYSGKTSYGLDGEVLRTPGFFYQS